MCCNADSNETATSKLAGPRYSARCLRRSHRGDAQPCRAGRLTRDAPALVKRELLGAKPIAVCPLRDPSRTAREILDE